MPDMTRRELLDFGLAPLRIATRGLLGIGLSCQRLTGEPNRRGFNRSGRY